MTIKTGADIAEEIQNHTDSTKGSFICGAFYTGSKLAQEELEKLRSAKYKPVDRLSELPVLAYDLGNGYTISRFGGILPWEILLPVEGSLGAFASAEEAVAFYDEWKKKQGKLK